MSIPNPTKISSESSQPRNQENQFVEEDAEIVLQVPMSPVHPIRHGQSTSAYPSTPRVSKPKVVSIPVNFVESVTEAKKAFTAGSKKKPAAAAVEIQKHVRGFLVRKKVEALKKSEREVDEIEKRIETGMDLILREEKERIRVNEMLMAVLLRLDSVRGVREYRRKVIRRAIALQEKVDSLSVEKSKGIGAETLETVRDQENPDVSVEETMEDQETQAIPNSGLEEEIKPVKGEETLDFPENGTEEETDTRCSMEESMESCESIEVPEIQVEEPMKTLEILEFPPSETVEDQEIPVKEIGVDEKASPMEEDGWSIVEAPKTVGSIPVFVQSEKEKMHCEADSLPKPVDPEKEKTRYEDLSGLKSMMERMVEENATMKGLVTELCERSALQCRLMGGLVKRVEHLEKTVHAMERRKKKKREVSGALASENKCCHKKSGEQ